MPTHDHKSGCAICDPTHCACAVFDRLRNVLPEHRQGEADRAGVNLDGTRKATVFPSEKPTRKVIRLGFPGVQGYATSRPVPAVKPQ
jgi:hypothetical protein